MFIKSQIQICSWYQCMDDTNSRSNIFKNQLDFLLDKFEVCSKATTKKSIHKLTLFFFAYCSFYADTSLTRGNSVMVCTLKN